MRKKWNPKSAMAAVANGQLTVFRAAQVYYLPKSTLHDRVSGKVRHCRSLSSIEEKELADFLAKVGYGRSN